jgi:hypothetical protein
VKIFYFFSDAKIRASNYRAVLYDLLRKVRKADDGAATARPQTVQAAPKNLQRQAAIKPRSEGRTYALSVREHIA